MNDANDNIINDANDNIMNDANDDKNNTNEDNISQTTNQIIKRIIPVEILINFLNNICKINENDNFYIINLVSYKKSIFNGSIKDFIDKCMPYYYVSKRKYLTRTMNYNNFITIIRQICNYLKIKYTNKIKYEGSSYDIIYKIYLNPRNI